MLIYNFIGKILEYQQIISTSRILKCQCMTTTNKVMKRQCIASTSKASKCQYIISSNRLLEHSSVACLNPSQIKIFFLKNIFHILNWKIRKIM